MNELHAIFRSSPDGRSWEAYSRPVSVHAGGRTFEQAVENFLLAAAFHFDEDWQHVSVVQYVEHQAAPGVFIRTLLDQYKPLRDHTAEVLSASLTVPAQLADLHANALLASTGDIVFVSCLSNDRLDSIIGQLGRLDTVQVCAPVSEDMVWWMPLASPLSTFPRDESETLGEAGLSGDDATVGDLIRATDRYRKVGGSDQPVVRGSRRTLVASR